ncbi:MAG: mandelate racemase/muconate lactonizing enzyme family protein [Pseudomonadota bacterium]
MKITAVDTYLVHAGPPQETAWSSDTGTARGGMSMGTTRHWLFVKLTTEDGHSGIGEGSGWPRVVETAVHDLAPLMIGDDARQIEKIWGKLHLAMMSHGMVGTVGGGAIGAIDMALWDLKGKALGVPVYELLGGKIRDDIPAYAHASTPAKAKQAWDMGYRAFKTGNVKGTVDKVAKLREALPDEADIMVDLHGPPWLTVPDAIAMGKALEPFRLLFLEEPLPPENLQGYAQLRQAITQPLAAGERHICNLWAATPLIKDGLVDIIQPDTGRCGGLSHFLKIAHLAEAHFIQVAPHAGTLGPVAEFAALHAMASIPNGMILERFASDWPGRAGVVTHEPSMKDGRLVVPDRPGLGVDLVLEEIKKFPGAHNASVPSTVSYAQGTQQEFVYTQPRWQRTTAFGREGH